MIYGYTDDHDVDEDLRTIPCQGGECIANRLGGLVNRTMDNTPTNTWNAVAFAQKNK